MKGWSVIGQGRSARRRFSSKKRRLSAPGLREVNVTPLRPADIYILADGRSRICRLTGQGPPLLINACIGRMSRSWSELDTPGWREWRKWPVQTWDVQCNQRCGCTTAGASPRLTFAKSIASNPSQVGRNRMQSDQPMQQATVRKYYFVSALHMGGDGQLQHCDYTAEFIAFLKQLEKEGSGIELLIVGDTFGFWELTLV